MGELSESTDRFVSEARCLVFVELFDDDHHHVDLFLLGIDGEFCRYDLRIFRFVVEFFCHLCTDACIVEVKVGRLFFFGAEAEMECGECAYDEERCDQFAKGRRAFLGAASASSSFSRLSIFFHVYLPFLCVFYLCYHTIFSARLKEGDFWRKR